MFGLHVKDLEDSPLLLSLQVLTEAEAVESFQIIVLRYSINTIKTHSRLFETFLSYCRNKNIEIFPTNHAVLNSYLIKVAKENSSIGSIQNIVKSVDFVSRLYGYGSIGNTFYVKNTIFSLAKLCPSVKKKRDGFSIRVLTKLFSRIEECGGYKSLKMVERRTLIMITICYYTLMRFDCIKNVRLSNLSFCKDYVRFRVPFSKTDQIGEGQDCYLVATNEEFDPYILLCTYLYDFHVLFGEKDSYLIPPFVYDSWQKSWQIKEDSQISYSTAYSSFKTLLKKFGIQSRHLSLHSMRIGGVTDDFQSGLPERIIDKKGRWKNPKTKFRYCKDASPEIVNCLRNRYT